MHQGRLISARPEPVAKPSTMRAASPVTCVAIDRVLNTAEANAYLRRAKGFLEKRRSSGVDSPRYLQRGKRGAVLYRMSDLIAWEDEHLLTSSSDHEST